MANAMLVEAERALATQRQADGAPAAPTSTLTVPDVVVAAACCLGVSVLAAVPGFVLLRGSVVVYIALMVGVLALGFVVARRSPVGPLLALGYSALLGLLVGGFTSAAISGGGGAGLIAQALVGALAGVAGMLAAYATPWGRRAARATRLLTGMFLGYFVLSIASVAAGFFGVGDGWGFYGLGTLGLVLCLVGVALACWSLLADFGAVDRAVSSGAPRTWSWSLGVSVAASVVWLYVEILRLLAIVRQ